MNASHRRVRFDNSDLSRKRRVVKGVRSSGGECLMRSVRGPFTSGIGWPGNRCPGSHFTTGQQSPVGSADHPPTPPLLPCHRVNTSIMLTWKVSSYCLLTLDGRSIVPTSATPTHETHSNIFITIRPQRAGFSTRMSIIFDYGVIELFHHIF